nr:MAG TPA: hypothetical protein [Caudoviricetes sp.]
MCLRVGGSSSKPLIKPPVFQSGCLAFLIFKDR